MAATATARSSAPARRAPARRVATPSRRTSSPKRHTPVTGFVPVAAAAGAVSGIADSGIFVWLTRGRLWIGLLGTLLVGIVGLNVLALGFSASSSNAAGEAENLARQNSALRAKIASTLSSEQVQATASELGLAVPEPGAIRYVNPSPQDAAEAAKRLRDGDFTVGAYVAPAPAVTDTTTTATATTIDPAATATTDPATTVTTDPAATTTTTPPAADPATTTPPVTDPAATTATPTTTSTGAVTP
jgi:cytoskeletal protein RodZ